MPAACKVCKAKDQAIAALELANQTLVEMVNLQRAIPASPAAAPPAPPAAEIREYPPLVPIEGGAEDEEIEEVLARLNDPGTDEKTAERLMAQLQAFNSRVERAE